MQEFLSEIRRRVMKFSWRKVGDTKADSCRFIHSRLTVRRPVPLISLKTLYPWFLSLRGKNILILLRQMPDLPKMYLNLKNEHV